MTKIMIVEDQQLVRDILEEKINQAEDLKVECTIGDSSKAPDILKRKSIDLVLMDICTENGSSGITACSEIKKISPKTKVILMTGMPEITFIDKAKAAGADSFIYKNISSDSLINTIKSTAQGYCTFPGEPPVKMPINYTLTERELTVLKLVCETKSRKEIAQELHMSESSIKAIISGILNKTGFDSILKYAVYAVSNGFIMPNLE